MGDPVAMLSLYPEFPKAVMSSVASCGEFVFLLDRSGSMQGARMKSATVLIMCYFYHIIYIVVSLSHSDLHHLLSPPFRILCCSC